MHSRLLRILHHLRRRLYRLGTATVADRDGAATVLGVVMEQCQSCSRTFKDIHALSQHARAKGHVIKITAPSQSDNDDGPSMASLMIEAQIDQSMGLPVDDCLADMLPDSMEMAMKHPHNWISIGKAVCRRPGCKAKSVMRDWKWRQTAGPRECTCRD